MRLCFSKFLTYITSAAAKLDFLTFMNSAAVSVTYFESLNNFLWHNGWADQPLTKSEDSWAPYVTGLGALMCVTIVISNQLGMSTRIAKFINHVKEQEVFEVEESKSLSTPKQGFVVVGSASKALISTTSLLSSVRDATVNMGFNGAVGSLWFPISVAAFCLAGNFLAVWVVLMEHNGKRYEWSERKAKRLADMVGITYGLSQLCIYSNSIFNPFLLTGVLTKRPGLFNSNTVGRIIFGLTLIPRVEFTIGSGQAILAITHKVFSSSDSFLEITPAEVTGYQKWRGGVTSAYKSVALSSSIFGFCYFLSDQNLLAALLPTFASLLAVPGVVAVLYPVTEVKLSENRGNLWSFRGLDLDESWNSPLLINS